MNMMPKDGGATEPRFAGTHSPDADTERAAWGLRDRVMAEIERLGLRAHVADMEIDGYTILPPEVVGPASFVEELRERALEVIDRHPAFDVDIQPDRINSASGMFGQTRDAHYLLRHGRTFEKALMNEPALAIITYLLGLSCRLQSMMAVKKGPGLEYMPLHADNNHIAMPVAFHHLPEHSNFTWLLTDYSEENGATAIVPGSHKLCRAPTAHEARDVSLFKPIEAKAGSILIHHGNVWHGAVPRRTPGLRVSVVCTFARWYGYMHDQVHASLPPEAFERNPERFSVLTGRTLPGGYGSEDNQLRVLSPFG
jgi:hypothetical protein